jgi:hypothetical protein
MNHRNVIAILRQVGRGGRAESVSEHGSVGTADVAIAAQRHDTRLHVDILRRLLALLGQRTREGSSFVQICVCVCVCLYIYLIVSTKR